MKLLSSILLATSIALLPATSAFAVKPTEAIQVKMQKLSINKASIDQLTQLPGIGESKAKAIVEHRKKQGPFKSVEQLKEVKGIGDKLFAKLEGKITL
ncbi:MULTISPECIES: helix-hairpin-helix domain-containing protein [Pseudoalteromonas]|uniref:ComEA family DNA-binding protein n=1 Tax=Pseudoalteromonas TaxID=53246 RepID=UPI0015821AB5|nr:MULTISPECIES: helix-hairpin-helix domain-containing protein [Pseudoalteromonas]MDI4652524.1 helix-hairpin-helix domain-containing protein [Pseudoalteromonas shioyasakiensis]NUJ38614.1 helix-hairpin-helix domain-containing protein [Pseudoalteromonas sp. 0303]